MREQAPLALPPPAGSAHWDQRQLLGERVTAALSSVNRSFVALAVELYATRPGQPVLGLPAHVLALLARNSPAQDVIALPYALFDMKFREDRFWRLETAAAISVNDAQPVRATDPRLLRFARAALTLSWHLVLVEPRAAGLALGMSEATHRLLAGVPVSALDGLARRLAPTVSARFCTRDRFWQLLAGMLRFVPEAAALERLRLLGLQLQGAESARAQQLHRRLRR